LLYFLTTFFDFVGEQVILDGWVEFGLEESEEQVKEIYCVCI
jgi:hypothetical protein